MATLNDVVNLLKQGDQEILEKQEIANESLESIDRNIKEFLGIQKRNRLDDLEDRRERKSSSGMGLGTKAAIGLGLTGAAAGGLLSNILGEDIGRGLKFGAALAALPLLYSAVKKMTKSITNGSTKLANAVDGTNARLKALQADADARMSDIDKKLKMNEARLKYARTQAAEAADRANDPRTPQAEAENRLRNAEAERARLESERAQLEQARAKAAFRQAEIDAARKEKARRLKQARIAQMEAADAARAAEEKARGDGAEKAQIVRERLEARSVADAQRVAEQEARRQGAAPQTPEDLSRVRVGRDPGGRFRKLTPTELAAIQARDVDAFKRAQQNASLRIEDAPTPTIDTTAPSQPKVPASAAPTGPGGIVEKGFRGLNLLDPLGQLYEVAEAGATVARTANAQTAAKVFGATANVLGSTAMFAGTLILTPSQVAEATNVDLVINKWNDIVTLLTEGGPSKINDVMHLHSQLLQYYTPDEFRTAGLEGLESLTKQDYLKYAGVLHDRHRGLEGISALAQAGSQSVYSSSYGRPSSSLGEADKYDPRAITAQSHRAAVGDGPGKSERYESIVSRIAAERTQEMREANIRFDQPSGSAPVSVVDGSSRVDNSVRQTTVLPARANNVDPNAYVLPGYGTGPR